MIAIIDYGVGNVGSVINMLKRIGVQSARTSSADEILKADKLLLPGVGSFDSACAKLHKSKLIPTIKEAVLQNKVDVLGICLGMHLLFGKSSEGDQEGLSLLPGSVELFDSQNNTIKVPHMGWNNVTPKGSHLFDGLEETPRFYFAHSYHVVCPSDIIAGQTEHGYVFTSAVKKDNIYGVQFHPEKSHAFGMQLLKNFVEGT